MGCSNSVKEEYHKQPIPSALRDDVWKIYHGNKNTGKCYCCGKQIRKTHGEYHCSHVVAEVKCGETTIENLRTCCPTCNLAMGNQNLYVYMKEKDMKGPGRKNMNEYLKRHKSQIHDTRTNKKKKRKK